MGGLIAGILELTGRSSCALEDSGSKVSDIDDTELCAKLHTELEGKAIDRRTQRPPLPGNKTRHDTPRAPLFSSPFSCNDGHPSVHAFLQVSTTCPWSSLTTKGKDNTRLTLRR